MRFRSALHTLAVALVAAVALTGCRSTTPMVDEVPPGEPAAIDGLWLDTAVNVKFHIGAGRIWAAETYTSGVWRNDEGQIQVVNLRRTGPRKYEGWHPGYQGPYYLYVQNDGSVAILLRTKVFGDYQAILQRLSTDDAQAFAAEQQLADPGLPWQDPAVMRGANTAAAPAQPIPPTPPATIAPATSGAAGGSAPAPPGAGVPSGVDFGRYHALLIGNNGYQHLPKLRSAESDVEAIATLLRDRYGFETRILGNAQRDDVLLALERYRRELTNRDNLLIYYAGHGWLDEEADEGYWLPVDATSESTINWIPNATLTSALKAIRAKHVLVVADSCYSGKLTRGIAVRGNRTPDYISRMAEKRARMVISSGGLEPVLDGGRGKHSVFAGAFLDALQQNDGVVDTTTLFSRIRRDVMLHADQTPELADIRKSGHEGGDFLFVPRER
jgi:hypothetical protein